ncbi:olfactory receptor 11L1-like [Hyla sarda]|uniref:olfactory receptor 11L1-like n=1 Tax=Hyla sarda TaxID=327740 RepID=UPI0024C41409|nr:olfactory receptor 11L1-like [Hyla sarda]
MATMNQTRITEFILLGFGDLHSFNIVFFVLFLIIFILTIIGNLLIIILVSTNAQLQTPMYYFLCHLSLSDLATSTNIVPNMLGAILRAGKFMTYIGCITQFYFFSGITVTECLLLTVMSYDRYLAICNPLRYSTIMDSKRQTCLSVWPWLLGLTFNLVAVLPVSNFHFCRDNIIDHVFCDLSPLQKISCSDTSVIEFEIFLLSMPVFMLPCGFITVTYVYIFLTIAKIPTKSKQKTFSTCSSHLSVVGAFYGTLIAKYMIPSVGHSMLINKIVSLLHTLLTPLFNPIIYSLRNQEIKTGFRKTFAQ